MRLHFASPALLLVSGVLACGQAAPASPEQAVCESLSGQVTALRIPLSTDPVVDGKLRAFVAAVRALEDTAIQAEMVTAEACNRIALDLGGQTTPGAPNAVGATTPTPETTSAEAACSAALSRIQEVAGNDPVPIAVSPPTCTTDFVRLGRCEATCAVQGPDPACEQLCQAEAAAYGLCRAARIAMPDFSGMPERWIRLGASLGRNVPWLLHAQVALGSRLVEHARTVLAIGAELPRSAEKVGPVGVGCLAMGTLHIGEAAKRLNAAISAGEPIMRRLGVTSSAGVLPSGSPVLGCVERAFPGLRLAGTSELALASGSSERGAE